MEDAPAQSGSPQRGSPQTGRFGSSAMRQQAFHFTRSSSSSEDEDGAADEASRRPLVDEAVTPTGEEALRDYRTPVAQPAPQPEPEPEPEPESSPVRLEVLPGSELAKEGAAAEGEEEQRVPPNRSGSPFNRTSPPPVRPTSRQLPAAAAAEPAPVPPLLLARSVAPLTGRHDGAEAPSGDAVASKASKSAAGNTSAQARTAVRTDSKDSKEGKESQESKEQAQLAWYLSALVMNQFKEIPRGVRTAFR